MDVIEIRHKLGALRARGDLPTIVRYVQAANELVRLTGRIDTQFPDEA